MVSYPMELRLAWEIYQMIVLAAAQFVMAYA
jgi:hypothetical protein